jgi:dihydropteroate synthase
MIDRISQKYNKILTGKKTLVMGILNITPDSFSDGGIYFNNIRKAVRRVRQMIKEGADIIDIGGESSRPGSDYVSAGEEISRILPVLSAIRKAVGKSVILSVDTYKSEVAQIALSAGADIINSLGGFLFDEKLARVISDFECPIIIYHIKGKPKTMQKGNITYDNVLTDINNFFLKQIDFGIKQGIKRSQFILDPGIGFGKTVPQNVEIIRNLHVFSQLNLPLAIGVSRKSHLGILLDQDGLRLKKTPEPTDRLEAGLAETAIAVLQGVSIVRTHDVFATKRFLTTLDYYIHIRK